MYAWERVCVVASAHKLIGATNPLQAECITIREDLAVQTRRNASDDENEGGDDGIFLGGQFTGNYLVYENVDPEEVKREYYINYTEFLNDSDQIYLDCYMKGYSVPVTFWQQLVPHLCMSDIYLRTPVGWLSGEVFLPIHLGGNHWVTGVIDLPNSHVYVFNSIYSYFPQLSTPRAYDRCGAFKGSIQGTNLVAVAMDGNNQIVPIAFGICKGETGPCWTWWMSILRECIGDNPNLLFISDRHAAIALAVENEFPLAFYAVCCRHLMMNLSLKNKKRNGLFRKICKAYIREDFATSMSTLQIVQPDAYQKLCEAGLQGWSRAHCPLVRYNYMTSNSVESVNAKRVIHRKEIVLRLAETCRATMQEWLNVPLKLQEAIDEEAILKEQILALMHRFTDRFTDRRVEINNLMVLHDHPLVDYGKYALGCMTVADIKKCVHLKSVKDELLRSMEEKRQLMANYKDM
uniref:Transposase, MuDR, MULE transposase domain protein n=1 Tax=Tanacetum cinerariifolium TaxID=118510 RepID=A0A6L2K8S8_TANCI|nr:transposase, MuDR, MULE transposase domain protein [Tanacetum cinerariifolium]